RSVAPAGPLAVWPPAGGIPRAADRPRGGGVDEVVKRIAGRRICRNDSSHVFHVTYAPPKAEGVCDTCGGELYQRGDDSEATVRNRLEVYHTQTEPIIDYYKAQGLLVTIPALGEVADVTKRAMDALKK
ncbi:nucleoside monophosphate kinase, partial [Streptomyces sp. NPDC059558]|uniref:nucleoside monophosphate kinase n=1 Tax=Streptomyces sp. NPDC059558 TaxID=3346864 RepID=UPI003694D497